MRPQKCTWLCVPKSVLPSRLPIDAVPLSDVTSRLANDQRPSQFCAGLLDFLSAIERTSFHHRGAPSRTRRGSLFVIWFCWFGLHTPAVWLWSANRPSRRKFEGSRRTDIRTAQLFLVIGDMITTPCCLWCGRAPRSLFADPSKAWLRS